MMKNEKSWISTDKSLQPTQLQDTILVNARWELEIIEGWMD